VSKTERIIRLISNPILNAALVFFGWSVADVTGLRNDTLAVLDSYFTNPARVLYLIFIVLACLIGLLFIRIVQRPSDEKDNFWVHILNVFNETIFVLAAFSDHKQLLQLSPDNGIRIFGCILYLFILLLMAWTAFAQNHSVLINGTPVFSVKGPYRFVRFPEHLINILIGIASSFIFNSIVGLVITGMLFISALSYSKLQDELIRKKYGRQWVEYMQSTCRVIPFLY
jgi:protein-S-isoprenylcysteine O-methyltransferase Ste14